jgi:hypothetical protein
MRVPGKMSIFAAALLGVGCVTPEEMEAERYQQDAAYMQRLSNRCGQFGYQAGGDQHSQCMQSLHQQNQANDAVLMQGVAAEALRQDAERERERRRLLYPNQVR